jgi:hypothetical protein
MSKLSLATSGVTAALGLLAAGARAEPVVLSLSHMDELTAGQAASGSAAVVSAAPQGAVTGTVAASSYATDPQGNIVACEIAITESMSPPIGTSTVAVGCACESTTTTSISPPG